MYRFGTGGETYTAGSWRKLKSFEDMPSMPREAPSCGDSWRERDGVRAGERTREGRVAVDGERFVGVLAERGLNVDVRL